MVEHHGEPPLPRDVLVRLHAALLPASVPLLAHVDVAASYLVSNRDLTVGGDWFDACLTADGRLALAVGDVVGNGLQSSVTMSDLRSVLGGHLQDGATIDTALGALDRLAQRAPHAYASTACVALLDPATGDLEYANRGHPPPMVVGRDGAVLLPSTGGAPLGAPEAGDVGHAVVPPDAALVLYTDGLVDRPDRTLDEARAELGDASAAALAGHVGVLDRDDSVAVRLCRHVTGTLGATGFDDDVTMLVAHRRAAPTAVDVRVVADAGNLGPLRDEVSRWGRTIGLGARDAAVLELAVSEAAANCVEHAYREVAPGPVDVHAELHDDGTAQVVVSDAGTWQPPSTHAAERGRGLAMARMGGVDVHVRPGPDGTTVSLSLPARRLVALEVGPARTSRPSDMRVDTAQGGVVRVQGAVDRPESASRVTSEVTRQSRGGLLPVTVELGDVTFLGSPGVRALQSLTESAAHGGAPVRLVAAPSSRAAGTLRLAGLPFGAALEDAGS